jgi:hypothetical protein
MELSEKTIQYVEDQIPEMAEQATRQAFWNTLATGNSVIVAQQGQLWEVYPDGSRRFIKDITGPVTVQQRHYTIPAA